MLIYDHNKKFVGLDDDDLRLLGFGSTADLLASANDIADFFVKKPGYIHNFKNFQWIDFILHSESDNAKAIINTGTKSFSCELLIKPFYLLDTPDASAYAISLQHVKPLSAAEAAELGAVASAPAEAPRPEAVTPPPAPEPKPVIAAAPEIPAYEAPLPTPEPEPMYTELPSFEDVAPTTLSEPAKVEIPEEDYIHDPYDIPDHLHADFSKPLEIEDDIFMQEEVPAAAPEAEPSPLFEAPELPEMAEAPAARVEKPMLGDYLTPQEQVYAEQMQDFKEYVYDPHIAADELGLPVDLIEEFIGDFISQAHEFHDELTEAATKADFDNVKLLSHKLKGVAANLRIEDSFEMLKIINGSHDQAEVEAFLKMFYRTIAKLEGKEVPEFDAAPAAPAAAPVAEPELVNEPAPSFEEPLSAPEPMPEPAAAPAEEEEDIYTFDIKAAAPEVEEKPAAAAPADDDIYAFDLAPEPMPDEPAVPALTEPEDLYGFEQTLPPMDETFPAEPEPTTEEPFAAQPEAPTAKEPEDLYGFEQELPPMDESFETPAPAAIPSQEEDLYGFETELPPMDTEPETLESPEEPSIPEAAAAVPPMNYSAATAANELGLPQDVVEELINDFTDHARNIRSSIEDAVASDDQTRWRAEAIKMKGIADNLRMNEIATALSQLDSAADAASAKAALEQLYGRIEQL